MTSVIWHEVECGSYEADLAVWEELAAKNAGPILDLGCGTGRVLRHLERRGYEILGLDIDGALVADLKAAVVGDARGFELGREFGLILAPMQLVQLFADAEARRRCLDCVASHLGPDGFAALAIVESMPEPSDPSPLLPDTCEVDGWVYSSLPVDAEVVDGEIRVRRLRQTVAPGGELSEEAVDIVLRALDADTLEREAEGVGLRPAGRQSIPPTGEHVGSTVVLLEGGA